MEIYKKHGKRAQYVRAVGRVLHVHIIYNYNTFFSFLQVQIFLHRATRVRLQICAKTGSFLWAIIKQNSKTYFRKHSTEAWASSDEEIPTLPLARSTSRVLSCNTHTCVHLVLLSPWPLRRRVSAKFWRVVAGSWALTMTVVMACLGRVFLTIFHCF